MFDMTALSKPAAKVVSICRVEFPKYAKEMTPKLQKSIIIWTRLDRIELPGYSNEPKDITFPASLLTAAISTFGIEASRKNGSKKDDKVAMQDGMVQTIRVITPIKIEGAEVIDPKPKK